VLLACGGAGDEAAPPLLDAPSADAGILNLAIWYPDQRADAIRPYPFAISGQMLHVRNVLLCNAYNGLELRAANAAVIQDVRGTVLRRGLAAPHSTEFSWAHDIRFSPKVWQQASEGLAPAPLTTPEAAAVTSFCQANLVAFELGRLDGIALQDLVAGPSAVGFLIQKRPTENPHPVFGLGGVVCGLVGSRRETGWDPWYYGLHYADLDRVPEVAGQRYAFTTVPSAARVDPGALLDVTQPPFSATGDGVADDTPALRQALEAAAAQGGGVVYLPPGEYRVTEPLRVPSGVELRGPLGVGKCREYRETCSLVADCGAATQDPETAPALVTLSAHSGLRGLAIVYPGQPYDIARIEPYPYSIRGDGPGVWVADAMLINSYLGVDLASARCDDHLVSGLWGTVLRQGLVVGGGSRGGRLERIAFSWGPWAESGRWVPERTPELTAALSGYCATNTTYYVLGDCEDEQTWGLAGFAPRLQLLLRDDGAGGCREARLWLTMHDVGSEGDVQVDGGTSISLLGYFGTGSFGGQRNWLEVGPEFSGSLRICAPTLQQCGLNHPMDCDPRRVEFLPEISLTTGKLVSSSAADTTPELAVDRSPWTYWEASAGAVLQVDLGEAQTLTRFGITAPGLVLPREQWPGRAELWTSLNGAELTRAATLETANLPWADMPLEPTRARYVQLRVTAPAADGRIRVASFDVYATP
jgi:hypothetical protein